MILFKNKHPEIQSVHHIISETEILIPSKTDVLIPGNLNEKNNFRYSLIENPISNSSLKKSIGSFFHLPNFPESMSTPMRVANERKDKDNQGS